MDGKCINNEQETLFYRTSVCDNGVFYGPIRSPCSSIIEFPYWIFIIIVVFLVIFLLAFCSVTIILGIICYRFRKLKNDYEQIVDKNEQVDAINETL